jgi:hypothetical protein
MSLIVLEIKDLFYLKVGLADPILDNIQAENCMVFRSNRLIFRTGTKELLEHLYKHYDVGFYSRLSQLKLELILETLLTPEQLQQTKFIYGRNIKPNWDYNKTILISNKINPYVPIENTYLIRDFTGNPSDHTFYLLIDYLS